jgi:hypothetical protein
MFWRCECCVFHWQRALAETGTALMRPAIIIGPNAPSFKAGLYLTPWFY